MGSGKSQSAIAYMNAHPDKKFVYITPYVDEATRIHNDCPALSFVEPKSTIDRYNYSKVEHTRQLLKDGQNITTTHSAFKLYTTDMIENIQKWKYTLIIDEAVDVLVESNESPGDVDLLEAAGFIKYLGNGQYEYLGGEYTGERLRDVFQMLRRNNLMRFERADDRTTNDALFYWKLHLDVMLAFEDVFILTYLFNGQDMKCYLDANGVEYSMIGIQYHDGQYSFTDGPGYMPDYTGHLSELIQIYDGERLNAIGEARYALSAGWFNRATPEDINTLKCHMYNYIRNITKAKASDVMWTTFKDKVHTLRGRGFTNQFVQCSIKASNEFRNRTVLAYCVNLFINPYKKQYLSRLHGDYDEDTYALSSMIQWIWRSAIRDGKPIQIYIPSQRMRSLLINWINLVEKQHAEYISNESL